MIWKRTEIIVGSLGLFMALSAWGGAHAQTTRSLWSADAARTFPVYTESPAVPVRLPPPGGDPRSPSVVISDDEFVPDVPYSYFWTPQDGMQLRSRRYARQYRVSQHSPGLLGRFSQHRTKTPRTRWLPAPSAGGWNFGESSWQARLDEGTELQLGRSDIGVPEWNETVPLSGISLSRSFMASSDAVSRWNYSLAFGAVDQSASGASDLEFGPTAGSFAMAYDYSPRLSLETHTEVTGDLFMSGITGQYDLGAMGRWRSGIARSTEGLHQGWRYRAMADVDLHESVSLGWVGERYTDGFMDIRRYAEGGAPTSGGRQRWSASWDMGRWGEWSGRFESVHGRAGAEQRRFGVSQQFWYSPNLRIGIHAEREAVVGDYDIGLRFSFPLF